MSVWGDVFDGLNTLSLSQLLLAYIAGTGYVLAQGELAPPRSRRIAALVALGAAILFVVLGDGWERHTMLVALAVAGIGGFVALAWLSARLLGLRQETLGWNESALGADSSDAEISTSNPPRPATLLGTPAGRAGGPSAVG